ncbi:hypothetical protein JTE90_018506, partial [Oedothorax gibbosus]
WSWLLCKETSAPLLKMDWRGSRARPPTAWAATGASTTTCYATDSSTARPPRTRTGCHACSTRRQRPIWTYSPMPCYGGREDAT